VLGTSRIQAALDPQAYAAAAGGRPPVNLALPGTSPLPLLEYIADSTTFRGIVLVEILPLFTFDGSRRPEERVQELLARYETHRVSPAKLSEDWLHVHVLGQFVFRAPALLPARFALTLAEGNWPEPNRLKMRPDRFGPASPRGKPEASTAPGERFPIPRRAGRPATSTEMAAFEARIERAVARIHARGGLVVLVYLAAWGERQEIEESRFPRATYWDPLASRTQAVTVATLDYPEFGTFRAEDSSHVDEGEAALYAAALGRIVRSKIGDQRLGEILSRRDR
jgi:hypothetical protein